jgi:hypothetical protein
MLFEIVKVQSKWPAQKIKIDIIVKFQNFERKEKTLTSFQRGKGHSLYTKFREVE